MINTIKIDIQLWNTSIAENDEHLHRLSSLQCGAAIMSKVK